MVSECFMEFYLGLKEVSRGPVALPGGGGEHGARTLAHNVHICIYPATPCDPRWCFAAGILGRIVHAIDFAAATRPDLSSKITLNIPCVG